MLRTDIQKENIEFFIFMVKQECFRREKCLYADRFSGSPFRDQARKIRRIGRTVVADRDPDSAGCIHLAVPIAVHDTFGP